MKKTKFTEEQILFALKQGSAGQPIADVCRQMGISEATYYVWKKKYADMGILQIRELRQLRDENVRLKHLVADLTLDRHILQEVIKKKFSDAQAQGYRTMDTRLFSTEHTPGLRFELLTQCHVVLPLAGSRQQCSAATDAGTCGRTATIRLRADSHPTNPRGMECSPSIKVTTRDNQDDKVLMGQFLGVLTRI